MTTAPILDHLSSLADPMRARLLVLLDPHELTVGELCTIMQVPQSTISRHLKTLSDAGWLASRREATSRLYNLDVGALDTHTRRLWSLVREQVVETRGASQDAHRLRDVLAERRTRSEEFFASAAGQWDRMRHEMFGEHIHLPALLGLLDPEWVIADLGCGTGEIAAALAPNVKRVIAVDGSAEMLAAARRRLKGAPGVTFERSRLEALPLDDGELDAAVLGLVLHHVTEPAAVLAEAARVLKPGGRLLIVDMSPHDREDYRRQMGHVWLGFSSDQIQKACQSAGFARVRVTHLPAAKDAKGPALFTAVAVKGALNNKE